MLHARPVQGPFRELRWAANLLLMAVLFAIPWIRVRGEPLVLLDIPARKFHVFGLVIFPQELYFLWFIVAGLAISLFFFTALAGRVWCGWACPQTVFTDVFATVARRIQGWTRMGPPARVAAWRRVLTHLFWIAGSVVIGFHLVSYFRSPYDLLGDLRRGQLGPAAGVFWATMAALSYLDFAFVRQTFCKYLCPYARFQGVLFDRDTLVIAYDARRGEPRGKRGRAPGDCVDCRLCVEVCPSDIDIREGLQLECIACTQCIDACNNVMHKLRRLPNLIGYRSLASLEDHRPARPLRPRVALYGVLVLAVTLGFAGALAWRMPFDAQVDRNRERLYQTTADGRIGNPYTLHIENRSRVTRALRVRVEGEPGLDLVTGVNPIAMAPVSTLEIPVFVLAPADLARGGPSARAIEFVLEDVENPALRVARPARFAVPAWPPGDARAR